MALQNDTMYIIRDEKNAWIYTIVSDLDEAMAIARQMNMEENQMYHHYVVEECTAAYGQLWLNAWKKVMDS